MPVYRLLIFTIVVSLISCSNETNKTIEIESADIKPAEYYKNKTKHTEKIYAVSDYAIKYFSKNYMKEPDRNKFYLNKTPDANHTIDPNLLYDFSNLDEFFKNRTQKKAISVLTWNTDEINRKDIEYINKQCFDIGFERVVVIREGSFDSEILSDETKE